jgi:hypothetical protein
MDAEKASIECSVKSSIERQPVARIGGAVLRIWDKVRSVKHPQNGNSR